MMVQNQDQNRTSLFMNDVGTQLARKHMFIDDGNDNQGFSIRIASTRLIMANDDA